MDCILPDSSVHGDSQGKNTGVGWHALLQGIYQLNHQGSPLILEWVAYLFSRGSSWTRVSCIAGKFFTSWATREAPWWYLLYYHDAIPTIMALLSISPFISANIFFMYLGGSNWGYIYLQVLNLLIGLILYNYAMSFFVSCYILCIKTYFVWYKYCSSAFVSFLFVWNIFSHSTPFKLCVFRYEMNLL